MSENTIENFKAAVHLIKPGELKAYGEITGAPAEDMAALVFKMKTYAGAALCAPRRPA